MKNVLTFIAVLCFTFYSSLHAQVVNPVSWDVSAQELGNNEFLLSFDAKLEGGWYIYSQQNSGTPPVPTTITFHKSPNYKLISEIAEFGKLITVYDNTFEKNIRKYAGNVSFQVRVKTNSAETKVTGTVEFMACDKSRCLPPSTQEFTFNLISTDLDNVVANKMKSNDFTVLKSKKYSDEDYPQSDVNYNTGLSSPVDVVSGEEEISYRATASRKKATPALPKEEIFNEEKTVNLESMSGDLLVAANAIKFMSGKSKKGNQPETATSSKKDTKGKQLSQAVIKPSQSKIAPQPFINPVSWDFTLRPVENNIYEMVFTAYIQDKWYLYSQNNSGNAPLPISFSFDDNSGIEFVDAVVNESGQLLTEKDPVFEKTVSRYQGTVSFTRKVKFLENVKISGGVKYMTANNERYLMPKEVRFNLNNSLLIPVVAAKKMTAAVPNPLNNSTSGNNMGLMALTFALAIGLLYFIRKVNL